MKKILKRFKGVLAVGLITALLSTSAYGSQPTDFSSYDDSLPDYLRGDESGGVLNYDVATGEVTYTPESETEVYSDETEGFSSSYDGVCFAENSEIEADPQPYSFGSWVKKNNPNYDVNTRSTVQITAHTKGGLIISGSGFMIGPNAVATCGHLLCNDGFGADKESWDWIKSAEIIPSRNTGSSPKPYGTANATNFICGRPWAKEYDSEYDWGIIVLDSNIGNDTGWRAVRYQSGSYNRSLVTVNGYGFSYNNDDMYTCTATITESKSRTLYSGFIRASEGDSGSPCFKDMGDEYQAIGIATSQALDENHRITGTNFRRIDKTLFNELVKYNTSTL